MSRPTPSRSLALVPLLASLLLGCTGTAPPSPVPSAPSSPVPSAPAPVASADPSPADPAASPDEPAPAEPPAAALAAEGGDPVTGQLGTYTWGDGGSDSPWLPGAPITVGAGEPLAVTFDPALTPTSWTALLAPSEADGPAGAQLLGEGSGAPTMTAPAAGRYTLALEVVVEGQGTANYAWQLDVR